MATEIVGITVTITEVVEAITTAIRLTITIAQRVVVTTTVMEAEATTPREKATIIAIETDARETVTTIAIEAGITIAEAVVHITTNTTMLPEKPHSRMNPQIVLYSQLQRCQIKFA